MSKCFESAEFVDCPDTNRSSVKLLLPEESSVKSFRCDGHPRASFPMLSVSSLTIFRAAVKVLFTASL